MTVSSIVRAGRSCPPTRRCSFSDVSGGLSSDGGTCPFLGGGRRTVAMLSPRFLSRNVPTLPQRMAFATGPPAIAVDAGVFGVERMSLFAVRDVANEAARLEDLMLSARNGLKMSGVDAISVHARVVKLEPVRNGTVHDFISDHVSLSPLFLMPDASVSHRQSAEPNDASRFDAIRIPC